MPVRICYQCDASSYLSPKLIKVQEHSLKSHLSRVQAGVLDENAGSGRRVPDSHHRRSPTDGARTDGSVGRSCKGTLIFATVAPSSLAARRLHEFSMSSRVKYAGAAVHASCGTSLPPGQRFARREAAGCPIGDSCENDSGPMQFPQLAGRNENLRCSWRRWER